MKNKRVAFILLGFIFVLGFILRVYKLDKIPPSLNWDEVAAGYNAYTIAHWGKDEWGETLPLVFTSFRDDKHPVHIYLTAPFVGIFGLNDFTVRFPAALFSSLSIILIFFLAKKFFQSNVVGLFAALFLSISPYHIHYSRGLWEVDFALFFFLLGLTLFFYGLEKYKFLYLAFASFGLSLYSYHSSKVVVPPLILLLIIFYFKKLREKGLHFFLSLGVFGLFILGLFLEPRLLGLARINQNSFSQKLLASTWVYDKTKNERLANFEIGLKNLPAYFSADYLFNRGDQNPRSSIKIMGEFYKIDTVFLVIGVLALVYLRTKSAFFILTWALLAPLPSALSSPTPNSTRALFMMGSLHLISAYGATTIVQLLKHKRLQILAALVILGVLGYEFFGFAKYYFIEYAKKDAIEWQYGLKEVVDYIETTPGYYKIYMDNVRQQPYIFFLFYSKTPLPKFLETVKYDETQSSSYNTVLSYDKYQFGGWDFVESYPSYKILYVVEPSKYSGLKYVNDFEVVKLVKYPNKSDAFFLVTGFDK